MPTDLKIFSGSANPKLAKSICSSLGIDLGRLDISRFSNDNLFVQIRENVREKDVFVVQSFTTPVGDTILELENAQCNGAGQADGNGVDGQQIHYPTGGSRPGSVAEDNPHGN